MNIVVMVFFWFAFISAPDLSEVRKMYPDASKSEKAATAFTEKLLSAEESNKTLLAYKGASYTIISKFAKTISDKVRHLKEGARLIDQSAASEPNNIEIRLIRLSVQESVPKVVNYRKNKKEDKNFILAHYHEQKGILKDYVKNFILSSNSFSTADRQIVK